MKQLPPLKHPTYITVLPVSKQKISYRPFTVAEEKNILVAVEANDQGSIIESTWELVNNCANGKLNKRTLPTADFEYLLLQIRSKSVGEVVEGSMKCESCGEKGSYDISIPELTVTGDWKTKDITVQPGYIITVGLPTVESALEAVDMVAGKDERVIATCIQAVTVDNEVYKAEEVEMIELINLVSDLPSNLYNKIITFIQTAPRLTHDGVYKCHKCGHEQNVHLEGFESFFG